MTPLLQVKDLRTSFFTSDGEVRAVDGVTFDIDDGRTVGLVGESGCGKSVTALSIIQLLPSGTSRIVGGEVQFQGRDLARLRNEEMRRISSLRSRARSRPWNWTSPPTMRLVPLGSS